ncbi:hypothetical protein K439DRAFT_73382 [Ramaria rubella]|nr:hypothetical protein K439DRAFT_73382 [Ramaria rubella]
MMKGGDKYRFYLTLRSLPNEEFHWALVLAPKDPPGEWLGDYDTPPDLIVYEAVRTAPHSSHWRYHRAFSNFYKVRPLNRVLLAKFADRESADEAIDQVVRSVPMHAEDFDSEMWTRRAMRALIFYGVVDIFSAEEVQEEALDRATFCARLELAGVLVNYREHTLDMRKKDQPVIWRNKSVRA